jgi:hypothetical protein
MQTSATTDWAICPPKFQIAFVVIRGVSAQSFP